MYKELADLQNCNKLLKELLDDKIIPYGDYILIKKENDIKILELSHSLGLIEENTWLKLMKIINK